MRKMDTLDELRADVHRDPRRVADEASRLVTAARADGDLPKLSRTLGVPGRARRALGDIALAELDLLGAIEAGQAADDDELLVDACVGLAGVLMFAGRSGRCLRAVGHRRPAGIRPRTGLRGTATRCRRAEDRLVEDALAAYEAALPTLRRIDARLDSPVR